MNNDNECGASLHE